MGNYNSNMRKEAENWYKQALKDFDSAEKNFKIKEYYLVNFLCQQAVEKGLKAVYIIQKKEIVPQTHSLIYLASELKTPKKFFSFLRQLNKEFIIARYPDAAYGVPYEMYDKEIAKNTLNKTEEVIEWIKSQKDK